MTGVGRQKAGLTQQQAASVWVPLCPETSCLPGARNRGHFSRQLRSTVDDHVFGCLELQAMEVHDLVLAKIERNSARERYDVMSLAQAGLLDTEILRRRHHEEVRPYLLSHQESRDLTLNLWIESCQEKNIDLDR